MKHLRFVLSENFLILINLPVYKMFISKLAKH